MILIIDNYDSFVHNLARYFRQLGQETKVIRNDVPMPSSLDEVDAVVISPGPCTPDEAGISMEMIRTFGSTTPFLGVCLGHQAIAQAFGGKISQASEPMHGRLSVITHHQQGIFEGLENPLTVGRYHSLIAETSNLPGTLEVTAKAGDVVMAIRHKTYPIFGVQFHPESVLTTHGYAILRNFLLMAGLESKPVPSGALFA